MVTPRSPEQEEGNRGSRTRRRPASWLIGVMVAAVALSAAVIIISIATRSGGEDDLPGVGGTAVAAQHLCASGSLPVDASTCGPDSAPVKIVEFADYQCPWCKHFVDTTELELETEYIQKGLVQLEFRSLAITGGNAPPDRNEATLAAEAAECANDQGRFWQYHHKLYAEQHGENQGAFLPERLKQFATNLGLDRGEFDACLDSHKHIALIEDERNEAVEAGVRSTPSFLINGRLVVGYEPFDTFRIHIEEALAEGQRQ